MSKKEFLNRLERMRNRSSVASTSATVAALTSDDIAEGTTNLYYTETRFDGSFANKDTDDLTEGATNFYYTETRFDTSFSGKDTGDLAEGSNLYYTQARFDTAFAAKDTDDLSEGSTNFYYTEARFDTSLAAKDTDDLSEGSTNFYYTEARFDSSLSGKDTDDLSEGLTNLYYTDERAQDAVGGMVDSTLTYDDGTPSLGVADGGIDTTQLADGAVTMDKIADDTVREIMTSDTTYYVSASGSDSNDGLSSGAPFLTIQKAVDTIYEKDWNTYTPTIQLSGGSGTFTENIVLDGVVLGLVGAVVLTGDTTTPSNYIITSTSGNTFRVQNNAVLSVEGFELRATSGNGFNVSRGGVVSIDGNMVYGAHGGGGRHNTVQFGGTLEINSDYTISGGGTRHFNIGAFSSVLPDNDPNNTFFWAERL